MSDWDTALQSHSGNGSVQHAGPAAMGAAGGGAVAAMGGGGGGEGGGDVMGGGMDDASQPLLDEFDVDKSNTRLQHDIVLLTRQTEALRALCADLGTAKDTRAHRREISEALDKATDLGQAVRREFHEHSTYAAQRDADGRRLGPAMPKSSSIMRNRLRRDFQRQWSEFEKVFSEIEQKQAMYQERASQTKGSFSFAASSGDSNGKTGGDGDDDDVPFQQLSQQQVDQFEQQEMLERQREMEHIHRQMQLVNDIHQDLARVATEQQEMVDDIEGQVVTAGERTEAGKEQLERAAGHQKAASGIVTKVLLFLGVVAVIVVVIVIAKVS